MKTFVGRVARSWAADAPSKAHEDFLAAEAVRMREVFYGRDANYRATGWNDPHQLGYAFGCRTRLEGDAETVMLDYWLRLADQTIGLITRARLGVLSDEAAEFHHDVMIEEARYALLGLPLTAD